jgi:hypothetical protein
MTTKALLLSLGNAALYLVACALLGTGLLLELSTRRHKYNDVLLLPFLL